jgi:chromosome segregation ATPase
MPLGLWKSKWEIHREDMERYREETERYRGDMDRHREEAERHRGDMELYRGETERCRSEVRENRIRWEAETREQRRVSDELRADYSRELDETRRFNRELLIRLEKTYANLGTTLQYVGEELGELKAAVRAHTAAVLKLVDRFEEWDGRPPA